MKRLDSPEKNNNVKIIFLVESYQVFREGFYSMFQSAPDMKISGMVETAAAMSQIPDIGQADIVIVDLDLPDKSGFEVCLDLANNHPSVTTILLCDHDWDIYLAAAYKIHAAGIIARRMPVVNLLEMLRQSQHKTLFTTAQMGRIREWQRTVGTELLTLKPREWKILHQLSVGLSNGAIANKLSLSKGSVEKYIGELLVKFNLNSRSSLVAYIYLQHLDVLSSLSNEVRLKLLF